MVTRMHRTRRKGFQSRADSGLSERQVYSRHWSDLR